MKTKTMTAAELLGEAKARACIFHYKGERYSGIRVIRSDKDQRPIKVEISRFDGREFGEYRSVVRVLMADEDVDVESVGTAV